MSPNASDPHRDQPLLTAGVPLAEAQAALILVHGRGSSAESIMQLTGPLAVDGYAYLAPQAAGHTWYPYPFLAPLEQNEPHLSSALAAVGRTVQHVIGAGITPERIVIGGFSQGACLATEFVVRGGQPYGGLFAFSGGVIGPPGTAWDFAGSLAPMPAFVGCSDSDPHIPLARVHDTTRVLQRLGAHVTERIYPGMAHTIIQDEIDHVLQIMRAALSA